MKLSIIASVLSREAKFRLFGGSLSSSSFCIETLCQEEVSEQPTAVYLKEDLDKITGTFHGAAREHVNSEIKSAIAREVTHAACLAYHLRDAIVYNGRIYAGRYKHFIARNGESSDPIHSHQAAVVSTSFGLKFFGHWLSDDCLQYEIARDTGVQPLNVSPVAYAHRPYYSAWFEQVWDNPAYRAYVDELVIYQDFAQGSYKRKRIASLRERLASHVMPQKPGGMVLLKRGLRQGAVRRIANEAEIERVLSSKGFEIVESDGCDAASMLSTLMGASLVISMEGSHSVPALFAMSSSGALIQLQPPDRFVSLQRELIGAAGVKKFGFVVGDKRDGGYHFDPSNILRVSDLALR